jgi:hypothetical protein
MVHTDDDELEALSSGEIHEHWADGTRGFSRALRLKLDWLRASHTDALEYDPFRKRFGPAGDTAMEMDLTADGDDDSMLDPNHQAEVQGRVERWKQQQVGS